MSIESLTSSTATNSASQTAQTSLSSDLNNFLNILTTQLQNQDPLSPLDTHEFTNQLVMFADVEQSIQQSSHLEDLISLQKNNEAVGAVSYIGKQVKVDHNEFHMESGQGSTLEYTLPSKAKNATIMVMDSEGQVVNLTPAEKTAGTHSFSWDGTDSQGDDLPSGSYTFQVAATDQDGNPVESGITYASTGTVTGVEYGNDQTTLNLSNISVGLGKVTAITTAPGS